MNKEKQQYENDTSVDDIYLGELASRIAQHERAELNRTRRMIDEQEKHESRVRRLPVVNPWDVQ